MAFVYINLRRGEVRTAGVRGDYQRNHAFVIGGPLAFSELPWSGKLTHSGGGS